MSIRPYSNQDCAVAVESSQLRKDARLYENPSNLGDRPFQRLLTSALGKPEPSTVVPDQATKEILPCLLRLQMMESWMRLMENGQEDAGRDLYGRTIFNLTPESEPGKSTASNIRRETQKNGDLSREALGPLIEEAGRTYGVDADLIRSVIEVESAFRSESLSPKGAMGLMQLMPETAKELGVEDPYDARQNIMGGTKYLRRLIDRYGGDVRTALMAYNWGMGNVERRPAKMPSETAAYVERVTARYHEFKA